MCSLNLASFVTTWMEPEAKQLMAEALDVNYVDTDEYPRWDGGRGVGVDWSPGE